jgi:SAM-dependent methyltransferase
MDLKEERLIGGDPASHWYYISKGRAIRSLIGEAHFPRVLDVGAGSGVFSRMLTAEGIADRATCVDPNYTEAQMRTASSARVSYVRAVQETDASLILMIDVIEHVDDDVALVADYSRMAPAGARFVISVPAFNFLWSSHDEFLDHRRRYTLDALEKTVTAAGLKPLSMRYFFGALFPAVAALRIADRALKGDRQATASALKAAPGWINRSLVAIHDLERAALFPFNKVAGVTAFCLAEKPALAENARAA